MVAFAFKRAQLRAANQAGTLIVVALDLAVQKADVCGKRARVPAGEGALQ
jgi:hypothetical protein